MVMEFPGGLAVGDVVHLTHEALTVELGPGIIASIIDGAQRPMGVSQPLFRVAILSDQSGSISTDCLRKKSRSFFKMV